MKKVLLMLFLSFTMTSTFASTLNVSCGEIKKVKEKSKNILPFPLSIIGMRTVALKVKLLKGTNYNVSYNGVVGYAVDREKTIKLKLAYTDLDNYTKHLNLLEDALAEKKRSGVTVYACFGKVVGIERWHNIASVSTRSENEALEEVIRKYL